MISPETVERVRADTDIVELVGSYMPLKKVGRNYRALCPFHQDRKPSFYVSPERQTYHCFGCGAGGNAIGFVMAHEKLEFPEAVRLLARRVGIAIEEETGGRNRGLYDVLESAARLYEAQLGKSDVARNYLARRGIDTDTSRRFRLGFAPHGNLLRGEQRRQSWPEGELVRAGLLAKRGEGLGDYFYERLVFPILSLSGKVIGFTGRVLDQREPKYLNTPDSEVFHKGEVLYGLFQAKGYIREDVPVLVEGNFDLLTLARSGLNNVVAPLGTALTAEQARLLRRYNERVLICFDGDEAGRKATRRALEAVLRAGCLPEVVVLPSGVDPDSYVRESGIEALRSLTEKPTGLVDFVLAGRALDGVPDERAAVRELTALLRLVGDETTQELYVNRLVERFGIDKKSVLAAMSLSTERTGSGRAGNAARRDTAGLEEKLVAAAAQEAEMARIARDLSVWEALQDDRLRAVARLMDAHCDEPGFGPARLLDLIDDEATRRLVAGWTFSERSMLTPAEYGAWAKRLRAAWLHRRIVQAHRQGRGEEAEKLSEERGKLLSGAARERSDRR